MYTYVILDAPYRCEMYAYWVAREGSHKCKKYASWMAEKVTHMASEFSCDANLNVFYPFIHPCQDHW